MNSLSASLRLSHPSWAEDVRRGINDFVTLYGKNSPAYSVDSYVVFDFDHTSAIYDVQQQAWIYQLETMRFGMEPNLFQKTLQKDVKPELLPWIDDISNAYRELWKAYGPFTPKGLPEETLKAVLDSPWWAEFASKMIALTNESTAPFWSFKWFTGFTENEICEMARLSCEKYSKMETHLWSKVGPADLPSRVGPQQGTFVNGITVTENIKELWRVLRANGIDVWVCSASELNQVRAAVETFGLTESITGFVANTFRYDNDGRMLPEYDYETGCGYLNKQGTLIRATLPTLSECHMQGKVEAIRNAIAPLYHNSGPLAGFMDSTGDFYFCTEFKSLKLVTCFNRCNRSVRDGGGLIAEMAIYERDILHYDLKAANDAGDTLYLLQGRDVNGPRTFRPANESLDFGEATPHLFKNTENWAQLWYIVKNHLSVADAFSLFAIQTKANTPASVLPFDYGFAENYPGYHTIE